MKTNRFLTVAAAAFLSVSAYAQTVDEIVDKHVAAMGGLDKLKSVNTIITERSIAVQGMEIPSKSTLVVGKFLRSESTIMGNAMVQVVDGKTGWMIRPTQMGGTGEPEDMPADQVKQQASQLDPFGSLVNYKEKGNKVELVGKEKVDKKDNYHLKVTGSDGQLSDQFIDAETYLISKVKMDMGGETGEIDFSNYKEVDGIKFANTLEMSNAQMGLITLLTNKVVINAQVDEALFKKPAK
ncbi:outer membrane lipoprotein-sorting protein [Dyadobacter bucti]|uniref:outer membrane lipoprotein-sorting protein n=1 Tax=Dyadobacter bucti TaxID=2572203 RepID=UPI001108B08F|nr:outer membrane lipoprotein-sorting protein [Dyadobacter bucti]